MNCILLFIFATVLISCSNEIQNSDDDDKQNFLLKQSYSKWNELDFYEVNFLQLGKSKPIFSEKKFVLKDDLIIEEISEASYSKANQEKVKYYLKDTLALFKHKGQLRVGETILKDDSRNKNLQYYTYLGFFPSLNQFLVKGEYADSVDYKVIDKNTGVIKFSFIEFPIISKNNNFIANCKTIDSENRTYFEIFNYSDGFYSNVIKVCFTNWRVVDYEESAFWGADGSFYLKVNRMKNPIIEAETFLKITLN